MARKVILINTHCCKEIIRYMISHNHQAVGTGMTYLNIDKNLNFSFEGLDGLTECAWHRVGSIKHIMDNIDFPFFDCFEVLDVVDVNDPLKEFDLFRDRFLAMPFWVGRHTHNNRQFTVIYVGSHAMKIVEENQSIEMMTVPFWTLEMINYFLSNITLLYSVKDLFGDTHLFEYIIQTSEAK